MGGKMLVSGAILCLIIKVRGVVRGSVWHLPGER